MRLLPIILMMTFFSCTQGQTKGHETRLDLSGQNLKTIPDSVFNKTDLEYLNLGSKEIAFYPPLSALHDSNANQITELPDKIGNLTKLKILVLFSNRLVSLPNGFTKLTNLEVLDVSSNKDFDIIKTIDIIKQLPNLKVLKIVDTKLSNEDNYKFKRSLQSDLKIIVTIPEYFESLK